MNYRAFLDYRRQLRMRQPELLDLGELDLWRSLAPFCPRPETISDTHLHRCHLAEAWTETFGLPKEAAKRALVSEGVRNSLSLLFPILHQRGDRVWLPSDVYPVYGELAYAAGLSYSTFSTMGELQLPQEGDVILLPNPLKPSGRWLDDAEVARLRDWLKLDSKRRLLLDAVYTFSTHWHRTTRMLLDSGQTILLHSLSKGWLLPRVLGFALVPEADFEAFAPIFRANAPDQAKLAMGTWLLREQATLPQRVALELTRLQDRLPQFLRPAVDQTTRGELAGYLVAVPYRANTLLAEQRFIAIPATVFGSRDDEWSVLSILPPADRC